MAICRHCNKGYIVILPGSPNHGGHPIGDILPCLVCGGDYDPDARRRKREPEVTGGLISRLVGWAFGWIILGILGVAAFAALVFVPRLFTKHDGDGGSGLVASANGVGYPADHQVGNCYLAGSWIAVSCDAPHDSQLYALVYIDAAPGSPFPAKGDLTDFGRNHCQPLFATYASGTPSDLGVHLGEAYPSATDWRDGVRQVLCGAVAVDGTTLSAPLPLAG